MKNHTLENTTETKAVLSPYQAKRAEAQAVPVSRSARAGDALLRLQRRVGNRAVQRLLVQRQEPEEEEELQMKPQAASLQRQELEEEEELMMKPDSQQVGLEGGQVAPEVEAAIQRARGGGQPLDRTVAAQMGDRLGFDFGRVRVHTDRQADRFNHQLSARAFTTGQDIFFRQGEYSPGSSGGRELIAHELTHVVQQGTGRASGGGSGVTVHPASDIFEQEADRVAQAATTGVDTPVHRLHPMEHVVHRSSIVQRQNPLEEQIDIEGRDFKALLKAHFDPEVHDMIDEAWTNIADGIRYMRAGQQSEGEFFFDLAARRLAAFMPQPQQVRPGGLALWSGPGARDYARAQGYTVLEDSAVGGVLGVVRLGAMLPEWPRLRPLWDAISRQYASLPRSGQVHIFAAARHNIIQILESPPEGMPVLISTELNALANKHTRLQGIGGGGVTEVWHILGRHPDGNLHGIDINGEFDDLATFANLADAAQAMQMYYVVQRP